MQCPIIHITCTILAINSNPLPQLLLFRTHINFGLSMQCMCALILPCNQPDHFQFVAAESGEYNSMKRIYTSATETQKFHFDICFSLSPSFPYASSVYIFAQYYICEIIIHISVHERRRKTRKNAHQSIAVYNRIGILLESKATSKVSKI